ncbi:hypothetical protein EDD17DRAFT_1881853 [Pisolithus thermaeus]|nr:hypothetical protein EV401DRAFT_2207602 [Pisolithus croceorrhizus]KAI6137508.1 hypothetical protein EDD17DRAFT_1881853 [Pisolithus thermaeus]
MHSHRRASGNKFPASQLATNHDGRGQHIPQTPHGPGRTPVRGLDDPFGSGPATQHGRPPHLSPEFSFPSHDFHGLTDTRSPRDSHSLPHDYLEGSQLNQPLDYTPHGQHHGNSTRSLTPFSLLNGSASQLGERGETPMDDYQSTIYSASRSRSASYQMGANYESGTPSQGLHATVAQLTASIKALTEVTTILEIQLTTLKEASGSLAARLDVVEKTVGELQEKIVDMQKSTSSKTTVNDHVVLKSIIQPLFCLLCGIDCDANKKNRVAALAAVRPLGNREASELSSDGTQLWHPDWLGKVDDELNAKFIKEIANRVYDNEKVQREKMHIKTIPDKSFKPEIIMECVKTYFRTIHKRAKELNSDEGILQLKHRQDYSRRRGRRVTVAAARHKAALQYEEESGHQAAAAVIDTNLGSDILTCNDDEVSDDTLQRRKQTEAGQSANRVIGHAWRSINYVAFLRWLSFRAMKQQQEGGDALTSADTGPQRKCCRTTTKKIHKQNFDVSPKHLNRDPPPPKAALFKVIIDQRWQDTNPDVPLLDGVDWLRGFYSRIQEGDIFEADADYLRELDQWLKTSDVSPESFDEEDAE